MYFNVVEALYIEEYKINLKFENGKTGVVNLAEYILQGEIFQPLQSLENFKNFTVTYGTLTWNNGEIDIAPETLYEKPIPEESPNSTSFESLARKVFSQYYGTPLKPGSLPGIPKKWDLLSEDGTIVGDAKYYTLVGGSSLPPAKFSTIAEHVWLLEKTSAQTKFLVFGNQVEVPQHWLARYGKLVSGINFFFLDFEGNITPLN